VRRLDTLGSICSRRRPRLISVRAARMGDRVVHAAAKAGIGEDGLVALRRAYEVAMVAREEGPDALSDDQNPALLHPGRTVLILLSDMMEADPRVLAIGALTESREVALRVTRGVAIDALQSFEDDGEAQDWWRVLPSPNWTASSGDAAEANQGFVELLVTAPVPLQQVVLAEALDQLRHAHLWESAEARVRAAELAVRVLHPLADRVHPVMARRYAWWTSRVGRGLLTPLSRDPT